MQTAPLNSALRTPQKQEIAEHRVEERGGRLRKLEGPSVSLWGRKVRAEGGGGAGATNGKSAGEALLSSTTSIHIKYNT